MMQRTLIAAALAMTVAGFAAPVRAADSADAEPLQALLVTGGCCHDYDAQKTILPEGISERANVEWTVVHEGGDSTDHVVSIYRDADWAEDYDVVVHNECFADVEDEEVIRNVVNAHKNGKPAVMIHCMMHTFRDIEPDIWRETLGVTSRNHGPHQPIAIKVLETEHPIMKGLPNQWKTPKGELYNIEKIWPSATPLAEGDNGERTQVCVWANEHGNGRVFGTTIGHHNETMQQEEYLEMVTRGLLWACDKLDDDGKPKAGYAAE